MIKVIHIGNFAHFDGRLYGPKNYAAFLKELCDLLPEVHVFGRVIDHPDSGFEFVFDQELPRQCRYTVVKGNNPDTPFFKFIINNMFLCFHIFRYCWSASHYFVFLPSLTGVYAVGMSVLFRRAISLGLYVGGYYSAEQQYERRGLLKRQLKRIGAKLMDQVVNVGIRKADYVITSSYELRERFKREILLTPPMINVTAQDLSIVEEDQKYTQNADITYCGELRHAKGIIDLVWAFANFIEDKRELYKLKIIGSGQAKNELLSLRAKLGLNDRISLIGQLTNCEDLKREITKSLMLVLPSYSEGFPRVAYECFTLGVPTILTPVGGIPYLVQDRVHCLFVEPGNVKDLSEKIGLLAKDQGLRQMLRKNARNLMRDFIFPRIARDGSLARLVVRNLSLHQ